ncbi:T9SS type A sorting domain-containing protein [Polluticaenibacter yanchengensis]
MLNNNQFLVWGDNNLAKSPAVPFGNIGGLPYQRFAAVWKVQNTNSVGTVRVAWPSGYANMKLIVSADEVFTTSDDIHEMDLTQVVNGIEYAYTDVTLTNTKPYFTIAAFIQAPGGVTNNISYWYRADKLVEASGDGADVNNWTDFTSGVTSTQLNEAPLPKFKTGSATYFNYNPGINFTAIQQMIGNIDVQTLTSVNFDLFSLTKEQMSGTRFFNIGMNNTLFTGGNWDHPGLYANGTIGRRDAGANGIVYGPANPGSVTIATTHPSIMYNTLTPTSVTRGVNGTPLGTPATHSLVQAVTGGHIFGANGGVNPPGGDDWGFTGDIGELVIYGNGNITQPERNKVESYLAIKYGLTLHNSNNYTTSKDGVVWDATQNAGFYNNVAGIGNDFTSALHQKQSRSQHPNTNGQVIIALGEIAETNAENSSLLADGQFLVWGDNGNTTAMTNTASTYTAFTYEGSTDNGRRMNRIWKVQNTGVNQNLLIRFPKLSVGTTAFPTGDNCADYVIVFASDAAFTNILSIDTLVTTEDGLNYDVIHQFPNGASYFTYARIKPYNQGIVYLPETIEASNNYTSTCDIGSWKYYRNESDNSLKLLGVSDYTNTELDNFDLTITPEGAHYDDLTNESRIMSRITTVKNNNTGSVSNGKIRVYYSQDELDATPVPSQQTHGWFKYNGDAEELIVDLYSNGNLNAAKTVALEPDATGVEDGVPYVEFHDVTSFGSFFYFSSTQLDPTVPLPVTLASFTATKQGAIAQLNWITATERDNKGFDIERSADSRNWSSIGFVYSKAANGNSNLNLQYGFDDKKPLNGANYYRLKQTDKDGKVNYSSVRLVDFSNASASLVRLYPNPANASVTLTGLTPKAKIVVFDGTGKSVLTTATAVGENEKKINIHRLSSGWYTIVIKNENGNAVTLKFVKE